MDPSARLLTIDDLLNAYFRNYRSADHKKVFIYSLIAIVSSTVFMLVKKT